MHVINRYIKDFNKKNEINNYEINNYEINHDIINNDKKQNNFEKTLKIITYNVSMLPFSKNIEYRLNIFIEAVKKYDIVVMQEIAHVDDIILLNKISFSYGFYSHYFKHGTGFPFWNAVAGTGIIVLSKYPIIEVMYKQYSINGSPHKILHADYFGAKGVGLCYIKLPQELGIIQLYVSHLHANYADKITDIKNNKIDEYRFHRVSQIFEMAQFIKNTVKDNLAIVCGDFNSDEYNIHKVLSSPNISIIEELTNMQDVMKKQEREIKLYPKKYSTFLCKKTAPQRLDYILFNNIKWHVKKAKLINIHTKDNIPISDHIGQMALLEYRENILNTNILNTNIFNTKNKENKENRENRENISKRISIIDNMINELNCGKLQSYNEYKNHLRNAFICFILFIFLSIDIKNILMLNIFITQLINQLIKYMLCVIITILLSINHFISHSNIRSFMELEHEATYLKYKLKNEL